MPHTTVFTKSVLKTKKKNKIKLLFLALGKVIKNNPFLFFFCSLLAVITALINFNIGINVKNFLLTREKTLTTATIKEIENEGGKEKKEIDRKKIREILKREANENEERQKKLKAEIEKKIKGEGSLKKKEAKKIIEEASLEGRTVFNQSDFEFEFNFFGWRLFRHDDLGIWGFIIYSLILILVVKACFSILHYYWMAYAYDSVERDLKKDLFRHFIRAKYANSTEVSRNLITQFADDLDEISYSIWFIPNRLIYVAVSLLLILFFDFNMGGKGTTGPLLLIVGGLFAILIIGEILLFKKASQLNMAAKKRLEEDNKVIYEKINNLEYIKAVSGEKYEEEKIDRQLDTTFRKNKKSLLYSTLFKTIPQYLIIPNIPLFFLALTLAFYSKSAKMGTVFLMGNFSRYFFSVRNLNNEINKVIESLLTLDELSSGLTLVNESARTLNRKTIPLALPAKNLPFENGDIIFQEVIFAYPKRPQHDILRNFSFRFIQGKIYGIAGKNGIGKSTITKTTLKLYDIKKGKILIGKNNVQEINTVSLHQHICYQTNRPTFFRMSIAENVYYPNKYQKKDQGKLMRAAKKVGIHEFINKLPQGFDTILREGGSDLSEGQKQQISALKIFINDYDIYILDEILSNVHPDLKGIILGNIFAKLKGKTVLVIDHHYEIFQYVDYIYQFTGEELIKMNKKEFLT
ncbi:MAG: ATP-binding cassette domain-containing protein [Candidatus Moeniiplasma glomeromycotorum]|nr:ATP-binding cassette domain-containing protein [Candidatus Moeniiplasma glomeromycotorum]